VDPLAGIRAEALVAARAGSDAPPPRTQAAAVRQMQVEFLTQLLGVLRKTVPENDFLPKSPEREILGGAFDRTVAEVLASQDALGMERALGAAAPEAGFKVLPRPADTPGERPVARTQDEDRRQGRR
jgi:hypothetical protein